MGISFKEIYSSLNDQEKKVVSMRLKGKSYKDINEYCEHRNFNYSSRDIRRVIDDALHQDFENYDLIKYEEIFKLVKWDATAFQSVFNEGKIIFWFLKYRLISNAEISLPDYLYGNENRGSFLISDLAMTYSANSFVFWTLLLNPENKYRRGYSAKNLVRFALNNNIKVSLNRIQATLNDNKNAIEIRSGEYLFFNYEKIVPLCNKYFKKSKIKPGIYSVEKIYDDNKIYFQDLDIKSSLSLHDVIKKNTNIFQDVKKIKVLSFPIILYGYNSKTEFFKILVKRYHNRDLKEVIEELHRETGIEKTYLASSYRQINKDKITKDGFIKATNVDLTDRQVNIITKKLKSDYYTTDDMLHIIRQVKESAPIRILETKELNRLGYRKEYNYCIKNEISNIKDHLVQKILAEEFFLLHVEDEIDTLIAGVIDTLVQEYKLIRISDKEFITAKKLRAIGIFKKDILEFLKQVVNYTGKNQFFTIKQLFDSRKFTIISESTFDSRFFEQLINTSLKFEKTQIDGEVLYCVSKNKVTRRDFIKWCFEKFDRSISLVDAVNHINSMFKISITHNTVKILVEENGMYYDETFEKIYKDKKLFLMEVFGNE